MNSVWVCTKDEQGYCSDENWFVTSPKYCSKCNNGVCRIDKKSCDAVEYAPVKRGRWELYHASGAVRCSSCGHIPIDGGKGKPYCYCGAKMEGE